MANKSNQNVINDFTDEILVKGTDGKFYILRNGELMPKEEASARAEEKSAPRMMSAKPATSSANVPDASRRKQTILDSYERGVRDENETRQTLMKSADAGGAGFSEEEARRVLAEAKGKFLRKPMPARVSEILKTPSVPTGEDRWKKAARAALQAYGKNIAGDREKLIAALATFLRDVRDGIELKDFLKKSSKEGGFGMGNEDVDELFFFASEAKKTLHKRENKKEEKKLAPPMEAATPKKELSAATPISEVRETRKRAPELLAPLPPMVALARNETMKKAKPMFEKPRPAARPALVSQPSLSAPAPEKKSFSRLRKAPPAPNGGTGRPRVEDITYTPKLVGPLEELAGFALGDFRYLAKDPEEAASRILQKLQVLEEESFSQKMEGVKAWKKSPLYAEYLSVGQKSLEEGKSVEDIIAAKEKEGKPTLSINEFRAIMEVNGRLRS